MIERHTFYVIRIPKVDWGNEISEGYFSERRDGTYAKDLGLARRYTKVGAERER